MNPPTPFISVIMPVYNGSQFFDRAIDSLRRQTLADWELLATDDGSADDSAARLEAWSQIDSRIRLSRHHINRGISAARNTAMAAARGELFAYLDCDDEFYPDHLARAWEWRDRADVLVFRYDQLDEREESPHFGQITTYDPAAHPETLHSDSLAVPLGVVHHRTLIDRVGGFDENLGRFRGLTEDADLWRRFVRIEARFAFVPFASGVYHIRTGSLSRIQPTPPPDMIQKVPAGETTTEPSPAVARPRVMFVSYHSYDDPASGASVCTRDLFAALASRGWRVGVFTGPFLDDTFAAPVSESFRGRPDVQAAPGTSGSLSFSLYTDAKTYGFPVTLFDPDPPAPARLPSEAEAGAFLGVLEQIFNRFRPDVVLTYGGDLASIGIAACVKRSGARIAFWLHNFAYTDPRMFAEHDAVIVPSEFSRAHHRASLGIDCVALPPVIDPIRVVVDRPDGGKYLTFVNPVPDKGISVFARIAEILGRDRPDIPLLVVESRGKTDWLGQYGVDLGNVSSLNRMQKTTDPRRFYRLSRVVIVPSLWRESFGRVAAEAMLSGIPVIASDRGALPEVVGDGGACLPIPADITPGSFRSPTAAEVTPWVDAILRLWDEPTTYLAASATAREEAGKWAPEMIIPRWEEFLATLAKRTQ